MRLALDAMGGDDAPRAMVLGAVDYARSALAHTVVLVGRESDIRACLPADAPANIEILHAPEVIGMADKLSALKEKPDDSMNRCAQLVKRGEADGMVLCGNTGCSVGAAQLHLRRIPGVKRAGILTPMPKASGGYTWICDCGANAVGKPEHLAQFGEMTAAFLQVTQDKPRPGVGVLSIGEEDEKGDELTTEALTLLRKTDLNILGNIEGHDIFHRNDLDVVVCDGFTGNVVLKVSEGLEKALRTVIREEIHRSIWTRLGAWLTLPAFARVRRRLDWRRVGGCVLLGVDGVCVIGHGRSDRIAVFHALKQAALCVDAKVVPVLREHFRGVAGNDTRSAPAVINA